ncbi:MLO-like protein 9 [Magnolia sinica]|uniref:MLO-like protein 9 n=1 Tax=Magnolia sinica TaxID=86752 RepID=UPI0026590FD3|nr:MLO-like protein 9 [Magnolia sinica]
MAGGGGGAPVRELDETPTWAIATVVAVIISVSIILEMVLHKVGEWFTRRRKRAMYEALEKVKGELMVLGFISLLLTFGQSYITGICISEKSADTMLPCGIRSAIMEDQHGPQIDHGPPSGENHVPSDEPHPPLDDHGQPAEDHPQPANEHPQPADEHPRPADENHGRRLLWEDYLGDLGPQRRVLSGGGGHHKCPEGKVPLVSANAIHQLHIFIFFLAVFHVTSSALTMTLGRMKIRAWKEWEMETASTDYEYSNDPSRFRFAHETSFVRLHTSLWTRLRVSFYILCFFRQFFRSVRSADYLTMRHGFIAVHLAPGTKFNFQKYIKRSLEDDFKVVVGISPLLWASVVVFLLVNVKGWHALFWVSVMPLITILLVGTKLQVIIMTMALEIRERHAVVQGIPLVHISDKNFWFSRPRFILSLIHFTLFQNAFQIIYFLWIWYEFGLNSCLHENFTLILCRVALGVGVQFLCSYITLPLYSLVSQMGTHMKQSIFDEQTSKALKKWHQAAKKKHGKTPPHSPTSRTLGMSADTSGDSTPLHELQVKASATGITTSRSNKNLHSNHEMTEMEGNMSPSVPNLL